jgi:hypothetical protein
VPAAVGIVDRRTALGAFSALLAVGLADFSSDLARELLAFLA